MSQLSISRKDENIVLATVVLQTSNQNTVASNLYEQCSYKLLTLIQINERT